MSDYTKSIADLSNEAISKIDKDIRMYVKSFDDKVGFEDLYTYLLEKSRTRKNSNVAAELFHNSFKAKNFWKDLAECGSWLEFRHWSKPNETKLYHANFCKRDKLCVPCAVRRAYKQQSKFLQIMENDPALLDREWFYIVLPVKHKKADSLEVVLRRVAAMRKSITKAMRNKRARNRNGTPVAGRAFWSAFDGGMYAQEITHTKNGWNVHLNLLVNAPGGTILDLIKHEQVWKGKKKVSYSSIDLSDWLRVHAEGSFINSVQRLDFSDNDLLRSALVEILKYSLKFSSMDRVKLLEVFAKTVGYRFFGTFGNLWGKGLTADIELDGDIDLDDDFLQLIFTRVTEGDHGYNVAKYSLYKREIKTKDD